LGLFLIKVKCEVAGFRTEDSPGWLTLMLLPPRLPLRRLNSICLDFVNFPAAHSPARSIFLFLTDEETHPSYCAVIGNLGNYGQLL